MQQGRNSSKPKSLYIMKKAIKTIGKVILVIIACTSLNLICAEKPDGGICLPWNLGWMAAFAISAKLLERMGAFEKEGDDVEI